jgi:hypothetical protein
VRQDDGVRLRVRQVQRATEGVAELVVQRHGRGGEHRAARQAPYCASARASRSLPSVTTRGSAAASARVPSSAMSETIGVASGA